MERTRRCRLPRLVVVVWEEGGLESDFVHLTKQPAIRESALMTVRGIELEVIML